MWPTNPPLPKFKPGDRVKHTMFPGVVGTIKRLQRMPQTPNSPFSYTVEWTPNLINPPPNVAAALTQFLDGYGKLDMTVISPFPEGLLEKA